MGTRSNMSNLDSLILSDDDRPVLLLKIQDEGKSRLEDSDLSEHDSDSSYEAKAKACADEMDGLIADAQMERDEKDRRIRQARLDKLKEREEKLNPFGRKVNSSRAGGKASGSGSNIQGILNNRSSGSKLSKKSGNTQPKVEVSSVRNNKKVVCKEVVREISQNEIQKMDNVSSKLKNVTIQDFGVDSTDTCSDYDTGSDFETDCTERTVAKQPKTFTIKHLNRVEVLDVEKLFDSDESEDEPSNQNRCYYSAEKSSAASRRKKSNYLNKRRSKFKQFTLPPENQQLEWTDNKKLGLPDINFWNEGPRTEHDKNDIISNKDNMPFKKTNHNKRDAVKSTNTVTSVLDIGYFTTPNDSFNISSTSSKSKPNNKFKKNHKNVSVCENSCVLNRNIPSGSRITQNAGSSDFTGENFGISSSTKSKPDNKFKRRNKSKNLNDVKSVSVCEDAYEPSINAASGSMSTDINIGSSLTGQNDSFCTSSGNGQRQHGSKSEKRCKSKNLGEAHRSVTDREDACEHDGYVALVSAATAQDTDLNSSRKAKSKQKKNASNSVYTSMKAQDEIDTKLKRLNEERIIPKYSGSTSSGQISFVDKKNDIVILTEISLVKDLSKNNSHNETPSNLKDNLMNPSNDIDWKSVSKNQKSPATSTKLIVSSDSEDIDFKAIGESANKRMDKAKGQTAIEQGAKVMENKCEDSSDFEAEFDACLVKFK